MTTTYPSATVSGDALRPTWALTGLWTRYEMGVWLKEPAAVVLNMAYPLIMLAFFFVSSTDIRTSPTGALSLLGYLSLVGILMVCLNFPANGIPETRDSDFYLFSRSLPIGAAPRLIGWTAAPIICGLISAIVTFGIGTLVSAATPTIANFAAIMGISLALAVPMTLIGLALGFILSKKTALAVSLTIAFTMILVGGISGFPMPAVLEKIARFLPSGAAGNMSARYLEGASFDWRNLIVLAVWTLAGTTAAILLYRRDEGRKFR